MVMNISIFLIPTFSQFFSVITGDGLSIRLLRLLPWQDFPNYSRLTGKVFFGYLAF
jgi:hypothetical protein